MSSAQRPTSPIDPIRETKTKAITVRERPVMPVTARVQTWNGIAGVTESAAGGSIAESRADRRERALGVACEPMS